MEKTESVIQDFQAMLELEGEKCHLKHSMDDPAENHPAVDFLCQKIGMENFTDDDMYVEVVESIIRIPVCKECIDALFGDEWVLFYCIGCNSSQWVCRRLSIRSYPKDMHVKWMDICPKCASMELKYKQ